MTSRWLFPFTWGIDTQALDAALRLAEADSATLVAASLIVEPQGKRSRGPRLEHIQQSKDFLEALKYTARRVPVPIECYEVWTPNVITSLEKLPSELNCECMLLVSRGGKMLLLQTEEFEHLLLAPPVELMLVQVPQHTEQRLPRQVAARLRGWLHGPWKQPETVELLLDVRSPSSRQRRSHSYPSDQSGRYVPEKKTHQKVTLL
ncbi:MAG: hypothetical protein JOZ71_03565 [Ktedonobacteraceae bacterium]|nr:hypothetical protein [Ktedonobacteraceae bacterium]